MTWHRIDGPNPPPMDGTAIDLWSHLGFRVTKCAWDVVEYAATLSDDPDEYGWTDAETHGSVMKAAPFTHWMPLPAPPTDEVHHGNV